MENVEWHRFGKAEEAAECAATRLIGELSAFKGDFFGLALSGGRIAKAFYQSLVAGTPARWPIWDPVHFFWADERCVPPADPESNYCGASAWLFNPLNIPSTKVHRIVGEMEPVHGAAQAEAELCRLAPMDGKGQPVLDVVILGMGEDGHVASLFPGETPEVMDLSAAYRSVVAVKPPPQRITIGYGVLAAAKQVWVLATGAGKESALRAALAPAGLNPLGKVLQSRSKTVIFTDIKI